MTVSSPRAERRGSTGVGPTLRARMKITDNAVIPMKQRVVDLRYDPVGTPRWRNRSGRGQ
jgi:hypothetical protein